MQFVHPPSAGPRCSIINIEVHSYVSVAQSPAEVLRASDREGDVCDDGGGVPHPNADDSTVLHAIFFM